MQHKIKRYIIPTLLAATLLSTSPLFAMENSDHAMMNMNDMKWNAGPGSLPKGAEFVVLEGDPTKDGLFTMRLKFPANYQIPAHWHPAVEHVTVISGSIFMGLGDKLDKNKATELKTGGFGYVNPQVHHFAFTHQPTVIQLNGIGPWGITYINPDDDPRNKKQ